MAQQRANPRSGGLAGSGRLTDRLKPGPLRILDAGGGDGFFSRRLAALGHQVVLCDLSEEMIARAQQAALDDGVAENMSFIHCAAQDIALHTEGRLIWYYFMPFWSGSQIKKVQLKH